MLITFLAKSFTYPTTNALCSNSNNLGHTVQKYGLDNLPENHQSDLVINRITGIDYDDRDLEVLKNWKTKLCANPPEVSIKLRDKYSQFKAFSDDSIETYKLSDFDTHAKKYPKWVIKPERSNQGRGLRILNSDELKIEIEKLKSIGDERYIVQPYIDYINEWRFIFAGNELIASIKKTRAKNGLHNSNGENFFREEPPKEIAEYARDFYKRSSLNFAAVDLFEYKGRIFLLEINLVPGLENIQKHYQKDLSQQVIISLTKDL